MFMYAAVALAAAVFLFNFFSRKVIIYDYEKGLLYKKGKLKKILNSGLYRIIRTTTAISKVDTRKRFITIAGQEILSADNITLKISLAVQFEIADPETALTKVQDFQDTLYLTLQLTLRDIVGAYPIDDILQKKSQLSAELLDKTTEKAKAIGINLITTGIKDIMFPGDLKNIFAQEVKARKDGLAVLERARAETAALRNLANAAALVDENPALLQLRMLQATGNTFVIGAHAGLVPIKKDAPGPKNDQ